MLKSVILQREFTIESHSQVVLGYYRFDNLKNYIWKDLGIKLVYLQFD